ncbi:MAG TPA: hypothetical protein VIQ60_02640, partial [Gemmatimonadaceae bacterium]
MTNWIYLECRLRNGAPRVDLILRVDRRGRDVLAGRNQIISLDDALHTHSVWRGIRALARQWSEPSSSLYQGVERIWLEFDLHARDGAPTNTMPAPGVFIEFANSVYAHRRTDVRVRVAMASLRAILPECLSADVVRNLRACWEVLPDHATIPYLGLFPARGSQAVRVCVAGLGEIDLPTYLRSVRWPGSLDGLARTIATLCPPHLSTRPRMAVVNLDVDRLLLPSVGIEYLLRRASQLRGEITEAAFLDGLVEGGFCSPAKRDALLTWPGLSMHTMRHEL